jgi:probable phosphoglycerate mutase
MPVFFLIRHGSNDFVGKRLAGRLPGVHLNERGKQQADIIAQALCRIPFKAVYSSPLDRAIETAEPLAKALSLPVNLDAGLAEIDFGEWQGMFIGRLRRRKMWKVVQEKPSEMRFPGGESFTEAQNRVALSLETIAHQQDEKALIACFSHADTIRLAVAHALGLPLDNFQRLNIDTASLTILGLGGPTPFLGPVSMLITPGLGEEFSRMFQPHPPKRARKTREASKNNGSEPASA